MQTEPAPKTLPPVVGKRTSSQNALRHGLLANRLVLEGESPEAFQALLAQYLRRIQPADGLELGLVEEMVAADWRMRRSWAIESHMLDTAVVASDSGDTPVGRITAAFTGLAVSPALPLMNRCETRLHMVYQHALHNLLLLRAAIPTNLIPFLNTPRPL